MASAFWNSWELWAKMCFVLACAIVIAIGFGCLKLLYNNWRVRKYSRIAASRKAIRSDMRHSGSMRRDQAKEVPFGIRALEKGVHVDGVWNSAANTPAPSMPGSPILSGAAITNNTGRDALSTRPSTSATTVTRIEISPPADIPHSSTAPEHHRRTRATYCPRRASGLRFSNSHEDPGLAETPIVREPNTFYQQQPHEHGSRQFSGSFENRSEYFRVGHQTQQPSNASHEDNHLHPPHDRYAPSSSGSSQESNPFLTPFSTRHSSDERVPVPHIDDVIPLECHDDSSTYHARLFDDADIAYDDGHAQPTRPVDGKRLDYSSQVVRKINSGFEILQPGSLGRPSVDMGPDTGQEVGADRKHPKKLQKKNKRLSIASTIQTQ